MLLPTISRPLLPSTPLPSGILTRRGLITVQGRNAVVTAGGALSLTPSGPVQFTANGQTIQNLDITGDSLSHAVNCIGFSSCKLFQCKITHQTGWKGALIQNAPNFTLEECEFVHAGHTALSSYNAYSGHGDLNLNVHVATSNSFTAHRVRCTGGSSGIYVQGSLNPTLTFIEGHNVKGPFPRGQLIQFNGCTDALAEDFSIINDANNDRAEDLFNAASTTRVTFRRGLTQGGASPSGSGGLIEGSCFDGLMEDIDTVDPFNVGIGGHAVAQAQSHGTILRRVRVQMGYTPYQRWTDASGTAYPRSANLTPQPIGPTSVPTTGPLVWSAQVGTTLFDTCRYIYTPSSYQPTGSPLPLNELFPSGNAFYQTNKATDLVAGSFTPRAAIVLTFPWEL